MREVILYNKALTRELLNKYKDYVCDLFLEIMRDLKIDCKLKVYIKSQDAYKKLKMILLLPLFIAKEKIM